MDTINALMERHHRAIIFSLAFVVVFFAAACTFVRRKSLFVGICCSRRIRLRAVMQEYNE